ncbi:MAG: hypothetical protein JW909_02685 [Planctomycetes bacterium]|nr:hypothetical protein [Planctomycetota bacterium]
MLNKKKKPAKRRSRGLREFFAGGLSRKGHVIPSGKEYDRRRFRRETEERAGENSGDGKPERE